MPMATRRRKPGEDKPVSSSAGLTVIRAVRECKNEADRAKRTRMELNKQNMRAYFGEQDWSHKQPGQSKEFLPKVPIAVEQFSAFIKRSLIQFGDWFTVDTGKGDFPITPRQAQDLIKCFLSHLADGLRATMPIHTRISDAVKVGLLESLMVLKVHGYKVPKRVFYAERGQRLVEDEAGTRTERTSSLQQRIEKPWMLAIDLIRPSDYFPDPTNRKLYKIHRVERDLHDIIVLAQQDIYDPGAVAMIIQDFFDKEEEWEKSKRQNQDTSQAPDFRKRVVIDEFWGDILDETGKMVEQNVVCSVANDRFLIRPPEPNPWWHGEDPFVEAPLIRVPDSVWHKAVFDHASPLNIALNELFNLMLDGGMASVWGIKQIRVGGLENPDQVADGIPQGITLAVKDEFPSDQKVIETVSEGEVPTDALAMFNLVDRFHDMSAYTNDLKMGLLPPKQVKATEVVEAQQSQAVTLDGMAADVEQMLLVPMLRKSWMVIMQNLEDISQPEIIAALGTRTALLLSRMSPAERFAAFALGCNFKVHGLSATLARVRDFQKAAALMQMAAGNPILMQAFMKRFSGDKMLTSLMKFLNMNPDHFEMDEAEKAQAGNTQQQVLQLSQMMGGGAGGQNGSVQQEQMGGEPGIPAEINQLINPMTGMAG
jgi:hypothetical protein